MSKPMGMMSGCYFVGRGELLEWINDLLAINYTKVEDTSNGAAFCQVIDAIHPGTVALGKVNYNSYAQPDMIANYKVLQDAFNKNGIKQYIDVITLTKGKYMAALEMFQWIHGYYMQNMPEGEYDAVARRRKFKCKEPKNETKAGAPNAVKPAGMARRTKPGAGGVGVKPAVTLNAANVPAVPERRGAPPVGAIPGAASAVLHKELNRKIPTKRRLPVEEREAEDRNTGGSAATASEVQDLKRQLKAKDKRIGELEDEADQMGQERDFYYARLRKIEDFCQDHESNDLIKQILDIMYETDESTGFVSPGDNDDDDDDDSM